MNFICNNILFIDENLIDIDIFSYNNYFIIYRFFLLSIHFLIICILYFNYASIYCDKASTCIY